MKRKKNQICLKTKGREHVEKHHSSAVKSSTKHAKQRPKKPKTPADVNSTNQQRLQKHKHQIFPIKRQSSQTPWALVLEKYNQGYSESNRLVLLCGTNNLSCKSLGQTILAADELVDTATSLNPTADIHMIALP